jgi:hypothetical protein
VTVAAKDGTTLGMLAQTPPDAARLHLTSTPDGSRIAAAMNAEVGVVS